MKIILDVDTTPRAARNICDTIAQQFGLSLVSVSDIDRDAGDPRERMDRILAVLTRSDIVVTDDYTLADRIYAHAMATVSPRGFVFTAANMDALLYERYLKNKKGAEAPALSKRGLARRARAEERAFTSLMLDLITPVSREL
jgi:uncharacterized protein YaiI (UPF0178 family)